MTTITSAPDRFTTTNAVVNQAFRPIAVSERAKQQIAQAVTSNAKLKGPSFFETFNDFPEYKF
jgi:hypothetical protein